MRTVSRSTRMTPGPRARPPGAAPIEPSAPPAAQPRALERGAAPGVRRPGSPRHLRLPRLPPPLRRAGLRHRPVGAPAPRLTPPLLQVPMPGGLPRLSDEELPGPAQPTRASHQRKRPFDMYQSDIPRVTHITMNFIK